MNNKDKPIPSRVRPFNKTQINTPFWLKQILGRDLAPNQYEYERVIEALNYGDNAMDRLITWIFEADSTHRKQLVNLAITTGDQGLRDYPEEIQRFFATLEQPPNWIDMDLLEEGIEFVNGVGSAAGYVLRDLALMGGYMLSGFNQTLLMTGALNKGTSKRIAETAKWWLDCNEPKAMNPFHQGYKSTLQVRLVHGLVRHGLSNRPDWDHHVWGVPISQIDMVATYLGFSSVMLGGLRKMGIPILPRESKAVMHHWAYVCWLMGVEPKWLVKSETEGLVLLNHTYMTQSKPNETSRELAKALSEEPLQRRYTHHQNLRRSISYHQHLGMSHYFLGKENMARLGFQNLSIPWFPLISNVPRVMNYSALRLTPGLRKVQIQKGRQQQLAMMNAMNVQERSEHAHYSPGTNQP